MTERIFNFSAGPAVLPEPVLEEAQRDLVALPGVGMSVLEISHRSKTFEAILGDAEADIRALAGIPDNYKVLFLQGGASLQFSMVPMNLLPAGATADYIDHRRLGAEGGEGSASASAPCNVAGSTESEQLRRASRGRPSCSSRRAPPTCTSRRTTRSTAPSGTGCRTSATCRSCATPRRTCSAARSTSRSTGSSTPARRRTSGPSGVTLVIIREDLLARSTQDACRRC